MESDRKKSETPNLPVITGKQSLSSYSYAKHVQEAPYRALVGVVIDGREAPKPPEYPRRRIRCQTGITNRWRLPQSLYSDMLGSSQALKAINMPFDHDLVSSFKRTYKSMNPMLLATQEFADLNERSWSMLRKIKPKKQTTDDEEEPQTTA